MFALYKLDGARTYRFMRTVKLGGVLAEYLSSESERKLPLPEETMDWEIGGSELRQLVMKRFSTPEDLGEQSKFRLIIDATYGRRDAYLFEICHVWGFADPTWCPILLRLCHLYEGLREHGAGTPVETLEADIDCSRASEFVHEFLYLQWGHHGGTQKNFGRVGFTNGALLWPPHLDHLLSRIGYTRALSPVSDQ